MDELIGKTVSHFQILEEVGHGGMGVVYKAQDIKLDRVVALKFLPSHLSASEQDKIRFIQEAKAAAALNHPNVCSIIDIQECDIPPSGMQMFIVMEFVDGQTLRDRKNSSSFKQAVDIGIQIADGLAAAHEKGIVHRDIKPENIMIRKDNIVQVMDFGLAKLRGVSRLTKEGSTIGTLGYMSPEQVQGHDADHRTDIFSLGVVLWELFTGRMPFSGVHETAIMYEIVNVDAPPMSSVIPEIDPSLDAIVLECLEKDPNERTQSAKQISIDLKRFKRESSKQRLSRTISTHQFAKPTPEQISERIKPEKLIKRFLWPTLSSMLAIAVILLAWNPWLKEAITPRPVMRFSIDLPSNAPLYGGGTALALSPDGRYLAYIADIPNTRQLYLRRMDQLSVQPIPGTEEPLDPSFSPDGQWIVFNTRDKLVKVSIFGGAPEDICETQGQTRGTWWAADNSIFFGHISRGIYRVSPNGGTPEVITLLDSAAGEISHRFPQLLPDRKTIIFTIKQNNITSFDEAVIAAQRLGTRERKILVRGGTYARYVPTGHLMYVRGSTIFAVPFDMEHLEVKGPPVPIEEGGWLNRGSGSANVDFSNTGALVFAPSGPVSFENVVIAWMDRHGNTKPLLDTARSYYSASLSPDGQKIALTIQAANNDIWVYQIARGTLTRLTFGGGNNDFPIWSPEGKYVVYQAEKGKSPNLFRKPWDGSGAEERLTNDVNVQTPNSFTMDGKMMTFTQNGDIWILPLDNERKPWPFIQSPASEGNATFSPDVRWMAYNSNESGKNEVYVVPFPKRDGKWQISTGGGVGPLWSRNGKELFYINGPSVMVVDVTSQSAFDFSVPRKVCDVPPSALVWDVSSDGQRFVVGVARAQQLTLTRVEVVLEWFEELKQKFAGSNK